MSYVLFKNSKKGCLNTLNQIISEMKDFKTCLEQSESKIDDIYFRLIDRNIKAIEKIINKIAKFDEDDEDIAEETADKFATAIGKFYRDIELPLRRSKDVNLKWLDLFNENLGIEDCELTIHNTRLIQVPTDDKTKHGEFNNERLDTVPHKFYYINEQGERDSYIVKGQCEIFDYNMFNK